MIRIAAYCARDRWGNASLLTGQDKYEAALLGIAEWLTENPWPDDGDFGPLYRAGNNAIKHEAYVASSRWHARAWGAWNPPSGVLDPVGEGVVERVAIHQITYAFTEEQWMAVWAVAEVQKWGGTMSDAAALIGIDGGTLSNRLVRARRIARKLWVAPDETPPCRYVPGRYVPGRDGTPGRLDRWKYEQAKSRKRRQRIEDIAA